MKKTILKIVFLALATFLPVSAVAGVSVHINIPLPPPVIFPAPPHVVVIPETEVYVIPDIQDEIFFFGGWWWRPWNGRWYRSRYYDRGWSFYHRSPYFYQNIPPGWRDHYRNRNWRGHRWEYKRIPTYELQRNWQGWKNERYWEKQRWGVQGMKPKSPRVKDRRDTRRPQPKPGHKQNQGYRPGPR